RDQRLQLFGRRALDKSHVLLAPKLAQLQAEARIRLSTENEIPTRKALGQLQQQVDIHFAMQAAVIDGNRAPGRPALGFGLAPEAHVAAVRKHYRRPRVPSISKKAFFDFLRSAD